jgi:hypothetical protein
MLRIFYAAVLMITYALGFSSPEFIDRVYDTPRD